MVAAGTGGVVTAGNVGQELLFEATDEEKVKYNLDIRARQHTAGGNALTCCTARCDTILAGIARPGANGPGEQGLAQLLSRTASEAYLPDARGAAGSSKGVT